MVSRHGWASLCILVLTSSAVLAQPPPAAPAPEEPSPPSEPAPTPSPEPTDPPAPPAPPVPLEPPVPDVPVPEPVEPPKATGPVPLSVTISGGGTKGAYMAGQLYYLQQLVERAQGSHEVRVYTGASAGAINSITSVLSQCGPRLGSPQQSLFWKVWIPVGVNDLFHPEVTDEPGLFSRKGFKPVEDALRAAWNAGLSERCDVLVGIAITRLNARIVQLAPGFPSLPRSLETVLVRVTGRGFGRPPLLTNYVDPASTIPQVILPLDGADAKPFEAFRDLVFASSAFPVGFTPIDLSHCMSVPGKQPTCTRGSATTEQFIDGGVFDNQPLGLSLRAMRAVKRLADGGLAIADAPGATFLPESRFVYVDPRVSDLPSGAVEEDARPAEGAIDVITKMLGMVESAQSAELLNVFQREASIRERLLLSNRRFPHVSSTFSGLLDRSFRVFDFYLGMYDAARAARSRLLGASTRYPEDAHRNAAQVPAGWRPFHCLRAIFDGIGNDRALCGSAELEDFRILARVTLDRLHDLCRTVPANHPACSQKLWRKKVVGVREIPSRARLRNAGESDIDFLLRLLARYHFHFRDLGLDRDDADDVQYRLTRLAQEMVAHLAAVQPKQTLPLGVLGRVGVDVSIGYVPPQHILHLSLGLGAELGYSGGIDNPSWTWLRFTAALGLDGFSTLLNSNDNYVGLRPKLGIEVEPYGNSIVQLRLGVRGGYQFSTGDRFMTRDCDFDLENERPCSRVLTEAYVSSSLLGLVRVHVAGVFMPAMFERQTHRFGVRPMVGLQLNSPF